IAVVNKEDSYLYNPAHAAEIKHSLHFPPFFLFPNNLYYGTDTLDTFSKLSDRKEDESAAEAYRRVIPSQLGLGGNYSAGLVFDIEGIGAFALGTYAGGRLDAKIVNRLSPRLDALGYFDAVLPSLTFAQNVYIENEEDSLLKKPSIGITFKNIRRYSLYDPDEGLETASIEVLDLEDNRVAFRSGSGYGFDIGGQAEVDTYTFLGTVTAAVVLNNIATNIRGLEYEPVLKVAINDDEEPEFETSAYTQSIPFVLTFGLARQAALFAPLKEVPYLGWAGTALDLIFPGAVYAADIDMLSPENSLYKRLHFGLEQSYAGGLIDWRLGLNQGYPTTGLNLNLGFYHLGFTYYTEELGAEVGEYPSSYYILHSSFVF
ncbi:MAG: hypothetical protein LBQ83_05265, partial [Candidatus Margulisbacteria bacterium]|nr:hypothetical protein [Candidatus Margulisiibacteriota bacterium]